MNLSDNGESFIKGFEKLSLAAYQDQAGIWTIGWGHTGGVQPGEEITQDQAELYFKSDVATAIGAVNRCVKVALTQNQFDALVSFVYNIGAYAFKGSHVLELLNDLNYLDAANHLLKWDHVTIGGVLQESEGLLNRRMAERKLFLCPTT